MDNSKKKTILMLPSWYPSKESPFSGSFFREQAITLLHEFNFIVIVNQYKNDYFIFYLLKRFLGLVKPKISFRLNDEGLYTYDLFIHRPMFICASKIKSFFSTHILKRKLKEGVGYIELNMVKKSRDYCFSYLKQHKLLPNFDFVYSLTSQDMAIYGDTVSKIFNVPHVTAEHAPFPWPGTTLSDSVVSAIESADLCFNISNDKIRQMLLQNIRIKEFYYVGNFVNENKFSLVKSEEHKIKSFLIVAANSFYKNLDLFVNSMLYLKQISKIPFKVIIAGYNSTRGYSKNIEAFEKLVKNSDISSITTLIQAVPRGDIPNLYASVDCFVMTSIQEGLPVSAIEASMCGLPIIATRCGGVEDYIDDKMGCIINNILDYKLIAQYCNMFLNDELKFDNNYIREKAIKLFGSNTFVSRVKKGFDKALDNYNRKGEDYGY